MSSRENVGPMSSSISPPLKRSFPGLHVLRVSGTPEARARQHMELLGTQVQQGALEILAHRNGDLIRRSIGNLALNAGYAAPIVRQVGEWAAFLYEKGLARWLGSTLVAEQRSVFRAIAQATGLPYRTIELAYVQSDGIGFLARISIMQYVFRDLQQGAQGCCSSAVALRNWSPDGKLRVARNFDYPMVGPWEPHATAIYHDCELPYWTVTTAGIHTAGLTAMNAHGLTVSVHAHFTRGIYFRGCGITAISEAIATKARTLGQAVDLARKMRPRMSWAIVVASGHENQAAVIETCPSGLRVVEPTDDLLTHTNQYHSQDLHQQEALFGGGVADDLHSRLCRMRELLGPKQGKGTAQDLMDTLSDSMDPKTGEPRVVGNTMSVVTNVHSVVFEPEDDVIWVSARPESPTGWGPYYRLDSKTIWEQSEHDVVSKAYTPPLPTHYDAARLRESMAEYRKAYRIWQIDRPKPTEREETFRHLSRAAEIYPEDGNLWLQLGLVGFSMKKWDVAGRALQAALSRTLTPHSQAVAHLFSGRLCDLAGEREEAIRHYSSVDAFALEPRIRKALNQGKRKAYGGASLGLIQLDLQFPDALHY